MKAGLLSLVASLVRSMATLVVSPEVAMRGSRKMRMALRQLTLCLLCCGVGGLAACAEGAPERTVNGAGGDQAYGLSVAFRSETGLAVPGVQLLDEGQQTEAAREAQRFSPRAFVVRDLSRTAYEHLSTVQARKLAAAAFPELVKDPAGGPPPLPAGEKVVGFPADNTAQIAFPGHKRGLIESSQPIALQTSPGHRAAINLHLRRVGREFRPDAPAVAVRIPRHLSAGIALGRTGVSVTPVTDHGTPLGGAEGELTGATVMYANSSSDADTVVKPETLGFSAEPCCGQWIVPATCTSVCTCLPGLALRLPTKVLRLP